MGGSETGPGGQRPSVGRVVHYVSRGSADEVYPPACRAAIVTEVTNADRGVLGLMVANPTGVHFDRGVDHGAPLRPDGVEVTELCNGWRYPPGSWHWPART